MAGVGVLARRDGRGGAGGWDRLRRHCLRDLHLLVRHGLRRGLRDGLRHLLGLDRRRRLLRLHLLLLLLLRH